MGAILKAASWQKVLDLRKTAQDLGGDIAEIFLQLTDINMDAHTVTQSGRKVYIYRCTIDDIKTEDIITGLCHETRFNGQTPTPYSVGMHVLNGLEMAEKLDSSHLLGGRLIRAWLLHDAEEAYLGDFPRPVKNAGINLPYELAAQHICWQIIKRYGLQEDEASHGEQLGNLVDYIDGMMLDREQCWRKSNGVNNANMLYRLFEPVEDKRFLWQAFATAGLR